MQHMERKRSVASKWRQQVDQDTKRRRSKENDDQNNKTGWAKKNPFITTEEQYKKIGSSEVYNDSSTEATYDWGSTISSAVLSSSFETSNLKSLKKLSAMKIAENERHLTVSILRTSGWNSWKDVWYYLSSWRRDSFLLFQMFATVFSQEEHFQCHPNVMNQMLPKRNVILKTTHPNSTNHRVERLFSNVRISTFVRSLNSFHFDNLVILEITKPMTYDDMVHLTNISNLTALKVGRINSIPDPVIARWCSSIKSGKWQKLQMLSLPLTSQASLIKLQQCAKDSNLLYLEVQSKTVSNIERDWKEVDYQNWEMIKDQSLNRLSTWGMKVQSVLKKYKVPGGHSVQTTKNTIWLDFNIVNHTYIDKYKLVECEYEQLWKLGDISGYNEALVLKNRPIKSTTTRPAHGISEGTSVNSKPQRGTVMKRGIAKKNLKVRNFESFFAL